MELIGDLGELTQPCISGIPLANIDFAEASSFLPKSTGKPKPPLPVSSFQWLCDQQPAQMATQDFANVFVRHAGKWLAVNTQELPLEPIEACPLALDLSQGLQVVLRGAGHTVFTDELEKFDDELAPLLRVVQEIGY